MPSLLPKDLRFDFIGVWKPFALASAILVLAAILAVSLRGVRLGIDFVGGVETQVRVLGSTPIGDADIRRALASVELNEVSVFRLGGKAERTFVVRVRGGGEGVPLDTLTPRIEAALSEGLGEVVIERSDLVGPRAGAEFRRNAELAIALSLAAIGLYMGARFAPRYVPGALIALVHDAVLSAAAVVVFGFAIDFTVIAALLTVVGYSLNDTIVIYDRIRENIGRRTSAELGRLVNDSLNETLSRTVLTAGTTLLASGALLALGGEALRGFSLAVTVGVLVGTYSSIFIASPALLYLSRRDTAATDIPHGSPHPEEAHGR